MFPTFLGQFARFYVDLLVFGNVYVAAFAYSHGKFVTLVRKWAFLGRAAITDGLSAFPKRIQIQRLQENVLGGNCGVFTDNDVA